MSGASAPPLKASRKELNGTCGFSAMVVVNCPVWGLALTLVPVYPSALVLVLVYRSALASALMYQSVLAMSLQPLVLATYQ